MPQVDTSEVSETRPPQKSYRRPRRRPAHLRTKTGCLTCRKRKKKCDETRVVCQNCCRRNVACVWPSKPGDTRQVSPDEDISTRLSSSTSPSPTSAGYTSHIEENLALVTWPGHRVRSPSPDEEFSTSLYTPSLGSSSPALTGEDVILFDFLRLVFVRQLIQPMAHGSVIEDFNTESMKLAFTTPYFMHALLACCGAEIPVNNSSYYRRIGGMHYAQAVAGLRAELAWGDPRKNLTEVLRTVIILCIFERSKPRLSRGVEIHLRGAAQLIQLYFNGDSFQPSLSEPEAVTQRLILEAFIFHTATSIPFQQPIVDSDSAMIDSTFSLAERRLQTFFLPEPPLYVQSPVLGVSPKLFGYIREVALMYQRYPLEGVNLVHCFELEDALTQWDKDTSTGCFHSVEDMDPHDLTDITSPNPTSTPNPLTGLTNTTKTHTSPLLLGPKLYVLAARILLKRMASLELDSPDANYRALVSDAMFLVTQLQPSSDYFAEYYCWPFLVLGTSVVEQSDRDCLMAQITAFWETTRNGTMRRLADMLPACWKTASDGDVVHECT